MRETTRPSPEQLGGAIRPLLLPAFPLEGQTQTHLHLREDHQHLSDDVVQSHPYLQEGTTPSHPPDDVPHLQLVNPHPPTDDGAPQLGDGALALYTEGTDHELLPDITAREEPPHPLEIVPFRGQTDQPTGTTNLLDVNLPLCLPAEIIGCRKIPP